MRGSKSFKDVLVHLACFLATQSFIDYQGVAGMKVVGGGR